MQDKVAIVNDEWILNHSISECAGDGIEFIDEIPNSNRMHSTFMFRAPNLLSYIDMANGNSNNDRMLFIEENFQHPNEDEISEVNRNQYIVEIRHIIESHDAKWISYHPGKSQHSHPLDTDDHTISSIERI